jgi:hypothetical protein
MHQRSVASHTIRVQAPIDQCQRFFTPAGEELWVEGWRPTYTIWTLLDFDTEAHYARYSRVTPATRTGLVEVHCKASADGGTDVAVTYTMTAVNQGGLSSLDAYRGQAFVNMIEDWKQKIDAVLPRLLTASIR